MIVGGMEVGNMDAVDLVDAFVGIIYEKNMLLRVKNKQLQEAKKELEELKIKLRKIGDL